MKKIIQYTLLSLLLMAGTYQKSTASHAGALELTYRHISGTTYEFTVIMYRYCGGIAAAPSYALNVKSASRGVSTTNAVILSKIATSGTGVPPLQPPNMFNCTTNPICYEEHVYRGTLDLSNLTPNGQAVDWIFSVQECCRSGNR